MFESNINRLKEGILLSGGGTVFGLVRSELSGVGFPDINYEFGKFIYL